MNMQVNPVGIVKDIYKITNNINGKIYIGQALDTAERFYNHCKPSAKDCLIDYAIKKYGKENFSVEILESQVFNYNEREKYWIKKLNSKVPVGYNVSDGGDEPPVYYGIHHPNASIKSQEILDQIIFALSDTQASYNEIAKKFNTNKKTVLGINHGYRYVNPALSYPIRKVPNINGKLTQEDVDNIIDELQHSFETNTVIASHYGVHEHSIRNINSGAFHYNPNLKYPIRTAVSIHSKVTYDELMEIIDLLQNTDISQKEIGRRYKIDRHTVGNINNGTKTYFREGLSYPLRLPPHKK